MRAATMAVAVLLALPVLGGDDDCHYFGYATTAKKAILIGNSDYDFIGKTPSSADDLANMELELRKLGYSGLACSNLTNSGFLRFVKPALSFPGSVLNEGDDLLFYYSGHGVQLDEKNFLLGVDSKDFSVKERPFELDDVISFCDTRKFGVNILIIDACRTPPTGIKGAPDSRPRGFDQPVAPSATFIAFASEPHMPAHDAPSGMSPFTAAIVAELHANADDDIDFFFRRVRQRVSTLNLTPTQRPWTEHALTGRFTLAGSYSPLVVAEGRAPNVDAEVASFEWQRLCSGLETVRNRVGGPSSLHDIFFSSDLLRLEMCTGAADDTARAVREALSKGEYEIRRVSREEVVKTLHADSEVPSDACDPFQGMKACSYETIVKAGITTKGVPGGGKLMLALPLHWGKRGHYEITHDTALRDWPGLTSNAAKLLGDAAQDVDFYEWNHPEAHGQTYFDAMGRAGDAAKSQQRFVDWIKRNGERIKHACDAGQLREALYWTGYTVHGVQDAVFHRGITNPEHAYRDVVEHVGVDTDEDYDAKIALAEEATTRFLRRISDTVAEKCWPFMIQLNEPWLSRGEKVNLGLSPDLTPSAYVQYRALSRLVTDFRKLKGGDNYVFIKPRWFELTDATPLWILLDRALPPPPPPQKQP